MLSDKISPPISRRGYFWLSPRWRTKAGVFSSLPVVSELLLGGIFLTIFPFELNKNSYNDHAKAQY